MLIKRDFYINGRWTAPLAPRDYAVIDPSTEDSCAVISLGSDADTDAAVAAAKAAFPAWAATPPATRRAYVEAILAQRLVRRICSLCKEEIIPSADLLADLEMTTDQLAGRKIFRGKGCDKCNRTGYKGRLGIYELMLMNDEMRDMIIRNCSTEELRIVARKFGMVTLRDADFAEGAVIAVVRESEGGDARGVGLEREREHVVHQAHMFAVAAWNTRGRSEIGVDVSPEAFGFLDADFHFANAGEVLIEFFAVARVEATLHAARVFVDEIEDGTTRLHAESGVFSARATRASAKHTFKEQARIRLGRHRRRGGAP